VNSNATAMVVVLFGPVHIRELCKKGNSSHGFMIITLFELNVFVEVSVIDMYAKFRILNYAYQMFGNMP
jgi:hypothetical protein